MNQLFSGGKESSRSKKEQDRSSDQSAGSDQGPPGKVQAQEAGKERV